MDSLFKNWKVETQTQKPSKNFATLAKKTEVLHRVLFPILPTLQLQNVFKQVVVMYGEKIKKCIEGQQLDKEQKKRLISDSLFLVESIRVLGGLDNTIGVEFLEYVNKL